MPLCYPLLEVIGEPMETPSSRRPENALGEAWSELTNQQRLVCVWRKAGFSNVEIAHHLGCSPRSVEDMFTGALAALRQALEHRTRTG